MVLHHDSSFVVVVVALIVTLQTTMVIASFRGAIHGTSHTRGTSRCCGGGCRLLLTGTPTTFLSLGCLCLCLSLLLFTGIHTHTHTHAHAATAPTGTVGQIGSSRSRADAVVALVVASHSV